MQFKRNLRGELDLLGAAVAFSFVNLFVKLAGREFPGLFVSGIRFAIGVALALAVVIARRTRLERAFLPDVLLRGFFGALSMTSTYIAIGLTGPGRAALLSNTYPLFVTIFGALFFAEKPTRRIVGSLAFCLVGAVLVVRDGSGAKLAGDLLALAGSVFAGIAVNYVRRASKGGVDPFLLYLSPSLFGLPVLAFASLPSGPPGAASIFFLVAVGLGAFAAQALMARGYRSVSAGKGSIVFFLETGLTVLLGVLFAGEAFTARFGLGLVLIFAGVWYNRR